MKLFMIINHVNTVVTKQYLNFVQLTKSYKKSVINILEWVNNSRLQELNIKTVQYI